MNWKFILSGGMFLVLAGLAGADYVSTSISTDGTLMLASFGHTDNGSYASRVMTVDQSEISRSMTEDESLEADMTVKGSGPILVSDYASAKSVNFAKSLSCVFADYVNRVEQESELYSAGILNKGTYTTSRVIGPGLTGGLEVNGSGMMSFGSQKVGNSTMRSYGFTAGNMTLRDFVQYGGRF